MLKQVNSQTSQSKIQKHALYTENYDKQTYWFRPILKNVNVEKIPEYKFSPSFSQESNHRKSRQKSLQYKQESKKYSFGLRCTHFQCQKVHIKNCKILQYTGFLFIKKLHFI